MARSSRKTDSWCSSRMPSFLAHLRRRPLYAAGAQTDLWFGKLTMGNPSNNSTRRPERRSLETHNQATAQLYAQTDRKSTCLNSSHLVISYAVFCLKKKTNT